MPEYASKIHGTEELTRKLRSLADLPGYIEQEKAGQIQQLMRTTAVDRLTGQDAVDTGVLRRSVETEACGFTERPSSGVVSVGIRTDVSYAIFIEYGTGPKGDPAIPHTDKESWVYPTDDGGFRTAHSQPPRPFMRPALYENRDAMVDIVKGAVKEVWSS